jgi:hypothetical protein
MAIHNCKMEKSDVTRKGGDSPFLGAAPGVAP